MNFKKWLRRAGLFILLAVSCKYTNAQISVTEISFGSEFLPSSGYLHPGSDVKTNPSTTQYRYNAGLNLQLSRKTDAITGAVRSWTVSVTGSYMDLRNRHYTQPAFPDQLFTGDIGLQHYRSLRNRWAFMGLAAVGVYSDLERISGHDLFVSAGGLFIKQFNSNFSMGFGGVATNAFGTPMLWPMLMVKWQLQGRYMLDISVPDQGPGLVYSVRFGRRISDNYDLSLTFRPRQMSYDVEHMQDDRRLMTYWELPVGLENRWHIGKADLVLGGGIMPLRAALYSEKKLSKVFSDTETHQLKANYYLKAGIQVKF